MPKVLTEARSICPELVPSIKIIDNLAYTRRYSEVFEDFVNWCVWQFSFPLKDKNPLENKYNEKEQKAFLEIFTNIQTEVRKRVGMWLESDGAWYDPLGRMYECITSKNKSSIMGQYFTPEPVVDMMVQINISNGREGVQRIFDPACGSGRMGLAAAAHLMKQKLPVWVTMNDIDSILTKVTAVNMCLNGVVGESTNMNGLDITGNSYRFGYRIAPILSKIPQERWELVRMVMLAKTGQDVRRQYVLEKIDYEQSFLSGVNNRLLIELEERQKIADEEAKKQQIKELKETIQQRMKGTLFEGQETDIGEVILPKKQTKQMKSSKKNKEAPKNNQGKLF